MGDTDDKRECADMSEGKHGSPASADLKCHDACAKAYPRVFKWTGGGKEVYVSGSFSDWKPIPMVRSQQQLNGVVHEEFNAILALPVGEFQYKFQVDGQWIHNPEEPAVDNEFGTKNNIISVKLSDYLRFEALDNVGYQPKKGSSPPGSYSQVEPGHLKSTPWYIQQIINLNLKTIPSYLVHNEILMPSGEPKEHSEPNRAILDHIYKPEVEDEKKEQQNVPEDCDSLAITYRYQEKYVTTIYYKPR